MGIFLDLGFKNRNGELEVPNSETIQGMSLTEFKNSFVAPKMVEDADGLITVQGTSLPTTINQEVNQPNWVKYQVQGTNVSGNITVNTTIQVVESVNGSSTIFKPQITNTNQLIVSTTGTVDSIDITTYVLD